MYKKSLCILLVALCGIGVFPSFSQHHSLTKLWQTDTILKVPESVLFDAAGKQLFVSNIDGQPWEKDGHGSIGKVALDGKIIKVDWVTGLNAPKGLGKYQNNLYAADIDNVVVIDVAAGAIVKRIPVEGAQGLNDISVDGKGNVFVTDSKLGNVYQLKDGKFVLLAEKIKGLNGVLSTGNALYVVAAGNLCRIYTEQPMECLTAKQMEPAVDGLEQVAPGEFLVSVWNGIVYYVKDGQPEVLLDTRAQNSNTADIGYDPNARIVYVPTFYKNSIVAYQLK